MGLRMSRSPRCSDCWLTPPRWSLTSVAFERDWRSKIPRWSVLGISLLFPLAGFGLLLGQLKFGPAWQLSGFLLVLLLQWVWDVTDHEGPSWRPRMRTLMTAGAAISLAFSLEQALQM